MTTFEAVGILIALGVILVWLVTLTKMTNDLERRIDKLDADD